MYKFKHEFKIDPNRIKQISSTKHNIVFDLDDTLIHSFDELKELGELEVYNLKNIQERKRIYVIEMHNVLSEPGEGSYSRMWGVYRPGWDRFRLFCQKYFDKIFVWSAGQPRYVDAIVNILFPDPEHQPEVIYTYNDCDITRENVFKPLSRMISDEKVSNDLKLTNTFIIDDRDDTFSKNVDNGIHIPAFRPKRTSEGLLDMSDNRLLQLEHWLDTPIVRQSKDIRNLDKSEIFSSSIY